MNRNIRSILSSVLGVIMVIACIWLVKFFTINISEWHGTTEELLYAYKVPLCVCLFVIVFGIFVQTRNRDD